MTRSPIIFAVAILAAGCGQVRAFHQQLRAEEMRAARAQQPRLRPRASRILHIRAYADADYRAEHPRWRDDIDDVVADANQLVAPQLDVALAVDGSREWNRGCDTRDPLACLSELARLDEGEPDVWVVAFTSALPQLSRELDVLGHADSLGRHVLLHGLSRLDEQDDFDMTARPQYASRGEELQRERKRHKNALTLVHAWAHTLGGLHGGDASTVMHPSYTPEQAAFTADTVELLSLMIDARLRGDSDGRLRETYVRWLEDHPDCFVREERERQLADLRGNGAKDSGGDVHAQAIAASHDAAMRSLTAEDRALLTQTLEHAREGEKDMALASAAELAHRYPHVAPLQVLACELGVKSSCTRAEESASASP